MFLLDTNIVIGLMERRRPAQVARFRQEQELSQPIALPAMVHYELRFGAAKSANPERNHGRLDDFLA